MSGFPPTIRLGTNKNRGNPTGLCVKRHTIASPARTQAALQREPDVTLMSERRGELEHGWAKR
jgi:hypothetical protein